MLVYCLKLGYAFVFDGIFVAVSVQLLLERVELTLQRLVPRLVMVKLRTEHNVSICEEHLGLPFHPTRVVGSRGLEFCLSIRLKKSCTLARLA